jgi:hypothetical protein
MARYNPFKGLQITPAGGLYQQFITVRGIRQSSAAVYYGG